MKQTMLLLFSLAILAGSCSTDNTIKLFNEKDLSNWTLFTEEASNLEEVFQVKDGVIHISGDPFGYMRTMESYDNYKLHVEWRWPGEPTNSGVFLHINGENMVWPHCVEAQLKHGNAGGFVLMREGCAMTVNGERHAITASSERPYKGLPTMEESSEKPQGEWNTYEITCQGNTIELVVNGVLQNKATDVTLTSGNIALQSEGGPIEFRNVHLVPLSD